MPDDPPCIAAAAEKLSLWSEGACRVHRLTVVPLLNASSERGKLQNYDWPNESPTTKPIKPVEPNCIGGLRSRREPQGATQPNKIEKNTANSIFSSDGHLNS